MSVKIKIALTDDHVLLRNGLANLLRELDYEIIFEADNGLDFLDKLKANGIPDIVLMDIHMPKMNGYETTEWLKNNYKDIRVLALSMYDDEDTIIRMLRSGAKGFLLKDCNPTELKSALFELQTKGFYYSELVTGKLIHSLNNSNLDEKSVKISSANLSEREIEFLKFSCTEMTYKEIAVAMNVSPRTIDGLGRLI